MRAAHVFAQSTGGGLSFGINPEKAAAALRLLADEIQAGTTSLESVRVITLASAEDWCPTVLRLKFHDRNSL